MAKRRIGCADTQGNGGECDPPVPWGAKSSEAVLVGAALHFSYGHREVLRGVDIDVRAGEVVGLLGPNGAGKSTLLGVLTGDLEPQAGEVLLCGRRLTEYSRGELARVRGVMPQASEFPFAYTARDIVEMGRHPWDTGAEENRRICEAAMEAADVLQLADRDVTRLSGGERARVTFARVLAGQARMILLDEPTAALDIAHQERTMELCRAQAEQGVAVLAPMHDIQLAAAYCNRIALMSSGRIVAFGQPEEVLTGERLTKVYGWPISVAHLPDGTIVVLPERAVARGGVGEPARGTALPVEAMDARPSAGKNGASQEVIAAASARNEEQA